MHGLFYRNFGCMRCALVVLSEGLILFKTIFRNGFVDNQIEIPVPKMGFVDHPLSRPLENAEIDQYANEKALKREPDVK